MFRLLVNGVCGIASCGVRSVRRVYDAVLPDGRTNVEDDPQPATSERDEVATDYDAPRKNDEENREDSIEELKGRRNDSQSAVVDEDEAEAAEGFELPGADLSDEELQVTVLPAQSDEFTCASCFLVRHRSQVAVQRDGLYYCKDCEG